MGLFDRVFSDGADKESDKREAARGSAADQALARNAALDFNDYQARFVPVENSFISALTPTEGDKQHARGRAISDAVQQTNGAHGRIDSRSNASIFGRAESRMAEGIARGRVARASDQILESRKLTGLAKMAAFGRGLSDINRVTPLGAARDSTAGIISDTFRKVDERGSRLNMIGTGLGAGIGSYDFLSGLNKPAVGAT